MNETIEIYASVSGNILQGIRLNSEISITKEEFVAGLKSGKYATTVSHGDGNGLVIQIQPEFCIIGKVEYQEALEDVELTNFELKQD